MSTISYFGSKSKIGKWIEGFYPKDIKTYVEPFSGTFQCYFHMNLTQYKNLDRVVYNDLNKYIVNLFTCNKNYKEFYEYVKNIPSQDAELFKEYHKKLFGNNHYDTFTMGDFDTATAYSYIMTQIFSGTNPEKSKFVDLKGKYTSKFDSFKRKLQNLKMNNHIDKITDIEMMDFSDLIMKYDTPDTLFYLDPPYKGREFQYYKGDGNFGDVGHQRVAETLKNIKGKFILSYYHFDELDIWFPKDTYNWEYKEFNKPSGASKGKAQSKAQEILIMNY
jgi:DNA adenine methylase